jgi:transposase
VLWAFVMVLSFSRQVFVRFFLGASMRFFARGHVQAFEFFGGVPRVLLYDNLESAVLERQGGRSILSARRRPFSAARSGRSAPALAP